MTDIEHGIQRASPGARAQCVCGVAITLNHASRWVHTEELRKGTPEDHAATPDRTRTWEQRAEPEEPVIRQQIGALRHIMAALDLEGATPEDLRELTAAGFGLSSLAWQASILQGLDRVRVAAGQPTLAEVQRAGD